MKVVLKPIKAFEVETEDGIELGTFNKDSEWQGMTKLTCGTAVIIFHSGDWFQDFMSEMFSCDAPKTVEVVKISPSLVPPKKEVETE